MYLLNGICKKTFYVLWLFIFGYSALSYSSADRLQANGDPYESINRTIFDFNLKLDTYLLKPVAVGYRSIMPIFAQRGVNNMFDNIGEVPNTANSILQGKLKNALKSTLRLTINMTLGFFCIFDVATHLGVVASKEDFGQTLSVWGVPSGPFLVVPFMGPYTVRSGAGAIVDTLAFDPIIVENVATRNALFSLRVINDRVQLLDAEELIIGDPYSFVRNLYLQLQQYEESDGDVKSGFDSNEISDEDWLDD